MPLTLNSAELPGIVERNQLGEYKIDPSNSIEEQNSGGILNKIWQVAKGVTGFIWKSALSALGGGSFSFSALWGFLIRQTQFIVNFNFGATDESLDQQIKGQWASIAGQYGGLLGQSLGWLVCGVAPAAGMMLFNEKLGLSLLREVGEEGLEEVSASLHSLVGQLAQNAIRTLFIRGFKGVRRWLRRPGNPMNNLLPNSLKEAWNTGKSWTIAEQIEEKIESINNPIIEDFLEELLEEFGEACIEAGYVIAGGLDSYAAEMRQQQRSQVIEVTPNREYPNEKFLLAGSELQLRETLPQMLATHEVLDQRDIGVVSTIETSQLFTQAMPLDLYAKIEWRSEKGNQGPRPCYQISSVKRSKIGDYDFIRQIAGGPNGYMWGRFKAVASMSDGHFITCYGATEDEAEDRCLALTTLSDADVHLIQVTEEKKAAKRLTTPGLQKEPTRVYPYRLIIVNRDYFSEPRPGAKATKRGYYLPIEARLNLRGATKPLDWDQTIARILAGPTASNPG